MIGTVRRIANKVVVMLKGKIVASGETAAVFSPPYHPYTELLLSSVPEMRRSGWTRFSPPRGRGCDDLGAAQGALKGAAASPQKDPMRVDGGPTW